MKVAVLSSGAKAAGEVEIPEVKAKPEVLREYFEASRTNSRVSGANTKRRNEVSGGGRKPWKQKGTGRARQGSIRAPHWRHGGVVFGPLNEKIYLVELTRAKKQSAVVLLFAELAESGRLLVVDAVTQPAKTKDAQAWLAGLGVTQTKNVYVLVKDPGADENRAFLNLKGVGLMATGRLDPKLLLASRRVVVAKSDLEGLVKGPRKEARHASV